MTRKELVELVGWLWIITGLISLFLLFLIFLIFLGVSFIPDLSETGRLILRILAWGSWVFTAIFSLPPIVAGLGILKRQEWARLLGIVLSILALFRFPLGTALGLFSLYVLTHRESIPLFS